MHVVDVSLPPPTPTVTVEAASAYELLMSLSACHDTKIRTELDRGDWYLRLRGLAPPDLLAEIAAFQAGCDNLWIRLLGLAYASPSPKDVAALQAHIAALDPLDLIWIILTESTDTSNQEGTIDLFRRAMSGDLVARQAVREILAPADDDWRATVDIMLARGPEETKLRLLAILQRWNNVVFSGLEPEILPILMRDAEAKRVQQRSLPFDRFIELATNGVRYVPEAGIRRVVLIPSIVYRPWVMVARYQDVKLICHPVAQENVTEGSDAPPERLVTLYKALGDERRLHALKKLASDTYTLQELADALGIAKSTMHHHIVILRVAGLVSVSSDMDKRYSMRQETLPDASALLAMYLARASP